MSDVITGIDSSPKWGSSTWRFTVFVKNLDQMPDGERAFKSFFGFDHKQRIANDLELTEVFTSNDEAIPAKIVKNVILSPGKIDFEMHGVVNAEIGDQALKSFLRHSCDDLLSDFKASSEAFLEAVGFSSVKRIAVGAEHFRPAKDRYEGYRIVNEKLRHVELHPEQSNEFLYQINYWLDQVIDSHDVRINRLMTWSCGAHTFTFNLPDGEAKAEILSFARLLTDVNSAGTFDTSSLTEAGQRTLLKQLFDVTAEIAEKGEPNAN